MWAELWNLLLKEETGEFKAGLALQESGNHGSTGCSALTNGGHSPRNTTSLLMAGVQYVLLQWGINTATCLIAPSFHLGCHLAESLQICSELASARCWQPILLSDLLAGRLNWQVCEKVLLSCWQILGIADTDAHRKAKQRQREDERTRGLLDLNSVWFHAVLLFKSYDSCRPSITPKL